MKEKTRDSWDWNCGKLELFEFACLMPRLPSLILTFVPSRCPGVQFFLLPWWPFVVIVVVVLDVGASVAAGDVLVLHDPSSRL